MPVQPLDVAVLGSGSTGSAAAKLLARRGHRVTMFERVEKPGPVGAGIMLQPTGQHVLGELGLLDRVASRGSPIDTFFCRTPAGKRVLEITYPTLRPNLFAVGIHRGVLFLALHESARTEPGVTLHTGIEVSRVDAPSNGRRAVFSRKGDLLGHFDLVVAANGANDRVAFADAPPRKIGVYPWGALWFVAEDKDRVYRDRLLQVVEGTHLMYGMLPTGRDPAGRESTSLYWSMHRDAVDAWRRDGFSSWRDRLRRLDARNAFVVDQIQSPDQVLFASYALISMPRYHAPGLVFLGDAAHAMTPQLGQGANLGLLDAMGLARALDLCGDVESAVRTYTRLRKAHIHFNQFATRWLTPFFQSDFDVLGLARNVLMPVAMRIPPFARLMVRCMAGLKESLLRGDVALPSGAAPAALPAEPGRADANPL